MRVRILEERKSQKIFPRHGVNEASAAQWGPSDSPQLKVLMNLCACVRRIMSLIMRVPCMQYRAVCDLLF